MKKVTKKELWNFVKDKEVVYSAQGDFPFTGIWETRKGDIVAKAIPIDKHLSISTDNYKYYIRDERKT